MILSGILLGSYVGLWAIVIVQTLVLIELLRQIGILRQRLGNEQGALFVEGEGLERGSPTPTFAARDLVSGKAVSHEVFRRRKTLLVFLTTRCQACRALVPELDYVAREYAGKAQIIAVCSGPGDECASFVTELRPSVPMLYDQEQQMTRSYQIGRTPAATLVDTSGIVRVHGIPNSRQHLESLLEEEVTISSAEWMLLEQEGMPMAAQR